MLVRFLSISLVSVGLAMAQDDPGGGGIGGGAGGGRNGMGGGMDSGSGMMMRRTLSKSEQIVEKLKLKKEQVEEFEKALSAGMEEAAPVRMKLDQARGQMTNALLQAKGEAEVKQARDAWIAASAEMTAIETKAFGKIYAGLKPNQQSKAAEAFVLMAGIFDPAPSAGRGAGRRGR